MRGLCIERILPATHFTERCEIKRLYNVSYSLGDDLRPGLIADHNDRI